MLNEEINKLSATAQSELKYLQGAVEKAEKAVTDAVHSHMAWLLCFGAGVLVGALLHML
jgi:hypothetical protein